MKSGTPRDYSEDIYKVYFEVEGSEIVVLDILRKIVGDPYSKYILQLEFGYELGMPIQCIPDLVRLLSQSNIAIYQVVRGDKIEQHGVNL
jgi:hypothetical protein